VDTLAYKPNLKEVHARLRSLYARQAGDRIFAAMQVPSPTLDAFKQVHPAGPCKYPDPAERAAPSATTGAVASDPNFEADFAELWAQGPQPTSVVAGDEEQALAAEFGERWQAYCRQVPAWIPRLH